MTYEKVISKLVFEMVQLTGHFEDHEIYQTYLQRALVIGMEHFTPHMTEIEVLTKEGVLVDSYKSVDDVALKLNIPRGNIQAALAGKRHSAHGFIFRRHGKIIKQWKRK